MSSAMAKPAALYSLTATEIVAGVARRAFTAEDVARSCLERIAERDPLIKAWASIDPEATIAQARRLDRGPSQGRLHGVPFGVKDVIETVGFPTAMGSPIYQGYRSPFDASCVALAKQAGALVMGKTATAEFAGVAPPATCNPRHPEHTPGGSSSGSGAAVADHMVPLAFGTQTGGSVLRPAAFCGVVGFKPTFGSYNPAGMKAAAVSFDTLGMIARSVDDIELFHSVLTSSAGQPQRAPDTPPRIGLCRTHLWDTALPETIAALEDAVQRLQSAGAQICEPALPDGFATLNDYRATINAYERARGLASEWSVDRNRLSPRMQKVCETGFAISREHYVEALRHVERCRLALDHHLADVDVLLTPVAPGVAPPGLAYAGDPRFQELWTMLHVPAMTLPTHRGPGDLPVGIQLVARRYEEPRLFAVARWIHNELQ